MKAQIQLCLLSVISSLAFANPCVTTAKTIEEKLACIEGLSFTEIKGDPTVPQGARRFDMKLRQPVDHNNPTLGNLHQKLILLHRDENEPVILQTGGYNLGGFKESMLAVAFEANQIQVEHRFWGDSKPSPFDWSKLTVKQSADDFHRIVVSLKPIYQRPWINTGGSKGGMTSIYHRRFYPNDLAGTLANVAPHSQSNADRRYITFLENVGGSRYEYCRKRWMDLQRTLLENRAELVPTIAGSFTHLGSADLAFEHSVVEASFYFWQYTDPEDANKGCAQIPVGKSPKEMYDYLQQINSIESYSDKKFPSYYMFQAGSELGSPSYGVPELDPLRKYVFHIDQYMPKGVTYKYDPAVMADIQQWVLNEASNIVFGYGEFDPWTAGEFAVPVKADIYKFQLAAGNHGANFAKLDPTEREYVLSLLSMWIQKKPVKIPWELVGQEFLEDLEFRQQAEKRQGRT
jgi:hypothetical protein